MEFVDDFEDGDLSEWQTSTTSNASVRLDGARMRLRVYKCNTAIAERNLGELEGTLTVSFDWENHADNWWESTGWQLLNGDGNEIDYEVVEGTDIRSPGRASGRSGSVTAEATVDGPITLRFRVRPSSHCSNSDHANTYLWIDNVEVNANSSNPTDSVEASVTTLQFIPGRNENPSDGGHPLDSGLIQVFPEGTAIPTEGLLGQDLAIKPVLDSWLGGDMTETLPPYLRSEGRPEVERGALDSIEGKYLDDVGPTESFREFRFHNGIIISFEVGNAGSIDQDSVKIEFTEGGDDPEDETITLGGLENSQTVLHDHEVNGIPWGDWYGTNVESSNRRPRYYKYDTEYEFDGVEGVRVTTIAGGWAGFLQDISRRLADDEAGFFLDVMDWPIPHWQAKLAMLFMPPGTQFLGDFLSVIPNTYSFVDFILLADGRRYVRVWDASAYPSLATYVDGERRDLEPMPYEPRELLLNLGMNKFLAQARAGVTPYTGPLPLYLLMVEHPEQAEFLLSLAIETITPLSGYSTDVLTHDVPRVTLGFHGSDGTPVADPSGPFDSVLGQLLPLSGEIRPE